MLRSFFPLLAVLVLAAGCSDPYEPHGTLLEPPLAAPDFELVSAEGPVAKSDFEGQIVVLSFGFAACPDVCPDTMRRIARALEILEPEEARQVQVLLVSVDPRRDDAALISRYAAVFDPTFIGLRGEPAEIDRVASDYNIHRAEVELPGGGHTVDHTSAVTVLDRRGQRVLIWSYGTAPEAMAEDLRFLIRRS